MPRRHIYTEEDKQLMIQAYQEGIPWTQMEQQFGRATLWMQRKLSEWGIALIGRRRSTPLGSLGVSDDTVLKRYQELDSVTETAKFFGVKEASIEGVLYRNEVNKRRDKRLILTSNTAAIVNAYRNGESGWSLADRYEVSGQTIYNLLHEQGITVEEHAIVESRRKREAHRPDIIRLYTEEGWTLEEIGNLFDMWAASVGEALESWGITRRQCAIGRASRLEQRFEREFLIPLDLKYESQLKIDNRYYDFYIPVSNLIIEVNGDYWHGNPKLYSTLNRPQKDAIKRDRIKTKLALSRGYRLLFIWEDDIRHNINLVKSTIHEHTHKTS